VIVEKPLVSIVTPSYNQGRFIERTIRSVLRQSYKEIEYIILDSCSADETAAILKKYRRDVSQVIIEKDGGQSDAVNKGFAKCNGTILAYLNSDDCYANENVVARAVEILAQNPDVDLIYGRRQVIDEHGFHIRTEPFRHFDHSRFMKACFLWQEGAFWTRSIYERAGAYVCDQYRFALDYEMWLRFLSCGAKFLAVPEIFGLFRFHDSGKTASAWIDVGFSEAKRAQENHFGRVSTLAEMYRHQYSHIFGVEVGQFPRATEVSDVLWWHQFQAADALLKRAPLDHWVFKDFGCMQKPACIGFEV